MTASMALFLTVAILLPLIPAFLLFKLLPASADVSGPWHGLQLKLGGAFAGYFLLVLLILGFTRTMPSYEVWTVEGQLAFADGRTSVDEDAVRFAVNPNATSINPEGDFRIVVYRAPDHSGDVQLPTLLVDYASYQPMGIDLEKRGKKSALKRRVVLEDTLVLRPVPTVAEHRDP